MDSTQSRDVGKVCTLKSVKLLKCAHATSSQRRPTALQEMRSGAVMMPSKLNSLDSHNTTHTCS